VTTRVEMLNRALLRIGADPISDEIDPAAAVHLAVFDSVVELLSARPWSFAKRTVRLVRLAQSPVAHYRYAYQLPAESNAPPRAFYESAELRRPVTLYDIHDRNVLTDAEQIYATILVLSQPARWPGDFREGFTRLLMAELALSVREDRAMRERLQLEAVGSPQQGGWGGLIGAALDADNQAVPDVVLGFGVNPLLDGRFV
jgi:hypothetical protein